MSDDIDIAKLRELYESSDGAQAALNDLAERSRNVWTLTVRIAARRTGAAQREIRDLMKALEELGCGRYIEGRHGRETRFRWHVSSRDVGLAAQGSTEGIAEGDDDGDDSPQSFDVLLTNGEASLSLPSNLTPRDALKLCQLIHAAVQSSEED